MRVGSLGPTVNNSLVGSFGNQTSSTESTLSAGPSGGIIGAGMIKQPNSITQREKSGQVKDNNISKYQRQDANNVNLNLQHDYNLPYPGPPGGSNSVTGGS